ncbi:MAG: hypothetical protein K8R53_09620, partial [Bacteroidales bacterium]|nr:hypothetical protein [Bacteroidales bacterium]
EGFWDVTLIIQDTSGFIIDTLKKEGYIETYVSGIQANPDEGSKLFVFPNPFSRRLFISCEGIQGPFSVFISDINGITIRTMNGHNLNNKTANLFWDAKDQTGAMVENGLYFISIVQEGKLIEVKKVLFSK